jgi:hypothetical protein
MEDIESLSDRTLKYGRNVMATAAVMIVLAWMPDFNVERFEPFGLVVSPGAAFSIWGVLCAVLIYYFANFTFGAWADIPSWGRKRDRELEHLDELLGLHRPDTDPLAHPPEAAPHDRRKLRYARWRTRTDVGVPCVMFLVALWAALSRLGALWPTDVPAV